MTHSDNPLEWKMRRYDLQAWFFFHGPNQTTINRLFWVGSLGFLEISCSDSCSGNPFPNQILPEKKAG